MVRRLRPQEWTRRDEAAWLDTEGYTPIHGGQIEISQSERGPLDSLAKHWLRLGIPASVETFKPWKHVLYVFAPRNVKKVAERVIPYLRTKKRVG